MADGAVVERVARVGRDNRVRVCFGVDELDGRVLALHGRDERVVVYRPLVGVRHFEVRRMRDARSGKHDSSAVRVEFRRAPRRRNRRRIAGEGDDALDASPDAFRVARRAPSRASAGSHGNLVDGSVDHRVIGRLRGVVAEHYFIEDAFTRASVLRDHFRLDLIDRLRSALRE